MSDITNNDLFEDITIIIFVISIIGFRFLLRENNNMATSGKIKKEKTGEIDPLDLSGEVKRIEVDEGELNCLRKELRKRDKFQLEETQSRNVLMVGRTRSGKTTAVGVIKDLCYQPNEMSIFSDTVNPKFQSFAIVNREENVKMTLNMIDTPGVFEVKEEEEKARTNEMILNVISQCAQNEITKIHCVIMFASFETGINPNDVEAIQLFSKIFNGATVVLCITRSESKPETWKRKIIKELMSYEKLKGLLSDDQVYFMGCFDSNTSELTRKDDIFECYKRVYQMRNQLINKVLNCKDPVQIRGLEIYKAKIENFKNSLLLYVDLLNEIDRAPDKETGSIQLKIQEIDDIQVLIGKNAHCASECEALVQDVFRIVREFKSRNKDNLKLLTKCTSVFKV